MRDVILAQNQKVINELEGNAVNNFMPINSTT